MKIDYSNLEKKITLSFELAIKDFPVSFGLFILRDSGEIFLYFFETKYAISLNFPLLCVPIKIFFISDLVIL